MIENVNPFLVYEIMKKKKRYARARNRIEAGLNYHGTDNLRVWTLTTKDGNDNSWDTMLYDLKMMFKTLRRKGTKIEYTFVPEYTPNRGLLHLHGLVFSEPVIDDVQLSQLWARYHNAWVTDVSQIRSELGVIKYDVKHIVKGFRKDIHKGRRRIIYSRGWLPQAVINDQKEVLLESWASEKKRGVKKVLDNLKFGATLELEQSLWQTANEKFLEFCRTRKEKENAVHSKLYTRV